MEARERKFAGCVFSSGSALILTVVLTSMLAIVGILFVMMARVDKMATSAISENRELDLAVESVIARISQELVSDTPGVAGHEYYDYPRHRVDPGLDGQLGNQDDLVIDAGLDLILGTIDDIPFYKTESDPWLAALTPKFVDCCETPLNYIDDIVGFSHITDLYGRLAYLFQLGVNDLKNDRIGFRNMRAIIIAPDLPIQIEGDKADADGDGVADSRWVIIPDITSSKGEPIYAALRVVDNGAMLNVNTALKFDPNVMDANLIDGSSQLQINLAALSQRGANGTLTDAAEKLQDVRCGIEPNDIFMYEKNVVWRYYLPAGAYTPFDISDELELRYRFLVNHSDIDVRIEEVWANAFMSPNLQAPVPWDPLPSVRQTNMTDWFYRSQNDVPGPDDDYSYKHLGTTYNMDRIIDPNGGKMININDGNTPVRILYDRLLRSIEPGLVGPVRQQIETRYAQLAVNTIDFADDDPHPFFDPNVLDVLDSNCVTTLVDTNGFIHYGFEAQPFITELGWRIHGEFPEDHFQNCYAVELRNPFDKIIDMNDFMLELVNREDPTDYYYIRFPRNLDGTPMVFINPNSHLVVVHNRDCFDIYTDPNRPLTTVWTDSTLKFFGDWELPDKSKPVVDIRHDPDRSKPPIYIGWAGSYDLYLMRRVYLPTGIQWIYVDRQPILGPGESLPPPGSERYRGRDVRDWRVIYQLHPLVEDTDYQPRGSLGILNNCGFLPGFPCIRTGLFPRHLYSFFLPNPIYPDANFITVGDIPRILTLGHGVTRDSTIGQKLIETDLLHRNTAVDREDNVRLDLRNPLHRNVFQYLTVFDPNSDGINNDGDVFLDGTNVVTPLIDESDGSEWKVPGRININTAPWYVLAQLPWVSQRTNQPLNYSLAQAIVAYRDKLPMPVDYSIGRYNAIILNSPLNDDFAANFLPGSVREQPGFASIGELNFIIAGLNNFNIAQYAIDGVELPGFPDLTTDVNDPPGDEVIDDYEERDVIFSRISNLVTVRSDVFTAYILVRIGADGPQKRAVAILDRSNVNKMNFNLPDGKVRIVALQYVPDPR